MDREHQSPPISLLVEKPVVYSFVERKKERKSEGLPDHKGKVFHRAGAAMKKVLCFVGPAR